MGIKYKNNKGLNERKANQSAMNLHIVDEDDLEFKEEYFEDGDQEKVEKIAGEQGVTSGDSFDKNLKKAGNE